MGDTVNAVDLPELLVGDAGEWRRWLSDHHADSQGVWLVLAKKGTVDPTTVSYDEALDEAICFGWIDGQLGRRDAATFRRRFTPRKARSPWSQRNAAIAERLIATGRMHRSGEDEVRQAKEDGRWEAAYAGQASIEVPEDLVTALSANPRANAMFEMLTSANRYAILYRIGNAKKPETRSRRIGQFVEMLARGETIHPQAPMITRVEGFTAPSAAHNAGCRLRIAPRLPAGSADETSQLLIGAPDSGCRGLMVRRSSSVPRRILNVRLEWEQTNVDANDPVSLGRWWQQALGWVVVEESCDTFEIRPTPDRLPGLLFVRVPEAKTVKNRLHLDFRPEDHDAEVDRLVALGTRRVETGQGERSWVVLADPEGNEFCVLGERSTR